MLNKNTLKILNEYAFSSDIDLLESSLIDLKQVTKVSSIDTNTQIYSRLASILKDIKPESKMFNDSTKILKSYSSDYDRLLLEYPNSIESKIYGASSPSLEFFKQKLETLESSEKNNIVAVPNFKGLDLSIVYINGYICYINLIGSSTKYTDLTAAFKNRIPHYIADIANCGIVDIRAKLLVKNSKIHDLPKSFDTYCTLMRSIRLGIWTNYFDIIAFDILAENDDNTERYRTQWDKLEYLSDIGFQAVDHFMVRGVTRINIENALMELDNNIDGLVDSKDIEYEVDGIVVKLNHDIYCNDTDTKFIYYSKSCKADQYFIGTVKEIKFSNIGRSIKPIINIIPVKCNDKVVIDCVPVNDICSIDDNDISTGKKIKFFIVNGKAILDSEMASI